MRKDYYENQKDKVYLPLEKVRGLKLKVNWDAEEILRPSFIGVKHFEDYDLSKVKEFISWDPFF